MSRPRSILPGTTYLITRRTVRRMFFLTPSPVVNQILLFCMARAAVQYGVKIHAFAFLSNHFHIVLTDPDANIARFMHWMDLYSAKCLNAHYGTWGTVWDPVSYGCVETVENDDVLEKIVYTLANPVAAGLVRWGNEWPGLRSRPEDIGKREFVANRPSVYFDAHGNVPMEARVALDKPEQFADLTDEEFRQIALKRYEKREKEIHKAFKAERRDFLGSRKARKQSPLDSPSTHERKRSMNPRIACRRKWPRVAAIERLKAFLHEYREALRQFRAGQRSVIFPPGTFWMRVHFGVACHAPP